MGSGNVVWQSTKLAHDCFLSGTMRSRVLFCGCFHACSRAVAIKEKQTRAAEEERRKREALLQAAADAKQRAVAIDAERQAIEEAERREQARLKAEEDARVAALKRMIAAQRAAQGYGATLSESDEDDGSECDSEKEEREAAEEAAWRQEMYDKLARDREEAEAKAVAEAEAKAAELEAAAAAKEDRDHQSVEG
jgi:colicin import membrane protein